MTGFGISQPQPPQHARLSSVPLLPAQAPAGNRCARGPNTLFLSFRHSRRWCTHSQASTLDCRVVHQGMCNQNLPIADCAEHTSSSESCLGSTLVMCQLLLLRSAHAACSPMLRPVGSPRLNHDLHCLIFSVCVGPFYRYAYWLAEDCLLQVFVHMRSVLLDAFGSVGANQSSSLTYSAHAYLIHIDLIFSLSIFFTHAIMSSHSVSAHR